MSDPNDVRAELTRLAERRRQAIAEREAVTADLRAAVRRAQAENVPLVEISRLAGISRQGIHKLLRTSE